MVAGVERDVATQLAGQTASNGKSDTCALIIHIELQKLFKDWLVCLVIFWGYEF